MNRCIAQRTVTTLSAAGAIIVAKAHHIGTALAIVASFMGSSAIAQDPTAEFVALWSEYIEVCGPALAAPEDLLANRQPRAGYDTHVYHSTPDQAAISIQHVGAGENSYIEVALMRFGDVHTLYCDVSRYHDGPFYEGQIDAVAENLSAIVAQSPGLAISGGAFDLLPDSQVRAGFAEDLEYHTTYVISGAFPDFPQALSQLYIDPYGMYLVLVTSWSIQP